MKSRGCLIVLIIVTAIFGIPAFGIFVICIPSAIDDFIHPKPQFPMPSLLPAFMGGAFMVLVPVVSLWLLYLRANRKPETDSKRPSEKTDPR